MIILLFLLIIASSVYGGSVVEKTLNNGIKVIVKETKGKGIVSGVVFFKGGQNGEKKRGETHLLFTLLLKGSKGFPSSYEVSLPFEKLGGYIYSSSGADFSEVGFATKVEGFKKALEVIRDVIDNPLFREEDLEREKLNTIVAIRSKKERGMDLAMDILRKVTYKGTPYESSPLGEEESVKDIGVEDLKRRLGEIRRGGSMVISLVGDMPAEEMIKEVEEFFSHIEGGEVKLAENMNPIEKTEVVEEKREGTQTTILCAFNAPPRTTRDYFAFKVLSSALGEGMTSVLFRELREKKGYAYATYAFYPTRYSSPRLFAYIGTSPEKGNSALKDMVDLIRRSALSEEDVEIAKNKIVGDYLLDRQVRQRQAWYMGFYEVMGLGWEMDREFPERIKEVSLDDIKEAVKKYIDEYHCVVVKP